MAVDGQVVLSGGRIVGATVVSRGAGEIASELGLAVRKKMKRLGSAGLGVWVAKMLRFFTMRHGNFDGL